MEEGIAYDELSDEDKEEYEALFANEDDELPERINSSALNEWIFNEDTIRQVLNTLMTQGIKIEYGSKICKTIIFSKNHRHAEKIKEIFDKESQSLRNEHPNRSDYQNLRDTWLSCRKSP